MDSIKQLFQTDFWFKLVKKFNKPKLKEKTNFFRLFSISQKAGLGLRDALVAIKKSENNKEMKDIIDNLIEDLTNGSTFSQAMSNHDYFFKEDEIALVQSAETMGNLPEISDEIANEGENYQKITQKVKKAGTYPAILLVFAIVAIIIMLLFVIPNIVSMFPSKDSLPGITKFMLAASGVIQQTRSMMLIGVISIAIAYKISYAKIIAFKMFIDKLMISIPVLSGVVKTFYMYKFTRLLGQLFGAGVSPILALKLMGNSFSNFYYKKKMFEIRNNLKT
ncbi:MAG: type II secretion system F family protein [bacterium]